MVINFKRNKTTLKLEGQFFNLTGNYIKDKLFSDRYVKRVQISVVG